jgi:hypothetical protein
VQSSSALCPFNLLPFDAKIEHHPVERARVRRYWVIEPQQLHVTRIQSAGDEGMKG